MSSRITGTSAALSAPLLMTIGFVIWDKTWKGGAYALNMFKCTLASAVFLCVVPVSTQAFEGNVTQVAYLVLSAFLGIFIGDGFWLYALEVLGPRKVIVCDCIKPFLAAACGYLFLDDEFKYVSVIGILMTMIGVFLISLERNADKEEEEEEEEGNEKEGEDEEEEKVEAKIKSFEILPSSLAEKKVEKKVSWLSRKHMGAICAVLNVIFDVFGSFLTRSYGEKMNTFEINIIRFGSASVMLWIGYFIIRVVYSSSHSTPQMFRFSSFKDEIMSRKEWSVISLGVLFVTFGAPALSNYALFKIELGICLTLTSIGPIFALPLTYISKGEPISLRSILAALLSFGGVAVLYTL